jgi:hypothetical protein
MKSVLIVSAFLIAAPAMAATDSFPVGGTTISFPVPAGYCRAEGQAAEVFKILAKSDTLNVTHLDILPCATRTVAGYDHIAVKTPVNVVNEKIARPELLAALKPEFDKPEFRANIASNVDKLTSNLQENTGSKIDLGGNFGPRGIDGDCAYVAGTLTATGPDGKSSAPQGAAACMSSVGGKFVSVNFYSADPSSIGIQKLMARARAMLLTMTARDAK